MQTIFSTVGDGYWSNVAKPVLVTDMQLGYVSDEKDFGELRVYFDTKYWDVNEDGLIYTDRNFIAELREFLVTHGLSAEVDYSEQGMQGDNYVSLDVEEEFLQSWARKFGQETVDKLAV
jgi:hypothetical protein